MNLLIRFSDVGDPGSVQVPDIKSLLYGILALTVSKQHVIKIIWPHLTWDLVTVMWNLRAIHDNFVKSFISFLTIPLRKVMLNWWLGESNMLSNLQCWSALLSWTVEEQGPIVFAAGIGRKAWFYLFKFLHRNLLCPLPLLNDCLISTLLSIYMLFSGL